MRTQVGVRPMVFWTVAVH